MLEIRDLHVHYGGIHALKGVSLDVPKGSVVTLIGANGAGKSSTLRAIAGLIKNKRGSIRWNGADIAYRAALPWYLSADANGDTISAAPDSGIAIGTDGLLIEWTANVSGLVISESDGDIDVTLTESTAKSFYLVLVLPGGKLAVSGAITFV